MEYLSIKPASLSYKCFSLSRIKYVFYEPSHACLLEFCGFFPFIPLMTSLEECVWQMKCTSVMFTMTELKRSSSSKKIANHQLLGYKTMFLICLCWLLLILISAFFFFQCWSEFCPWNTQMTFLVHWQCDMIHVLSLLFGGGVFCLFLFYL